MMYWLDGVRLIPRYAGGMNPKLYMEGKSGGPVCASIVTWKYVYAKVGGYNPDQQAGSDGDWNFRAILAGMKWGFISKSLYIYRRHLGQITKRLSREQRLTHNTAREKYLAMWRDQQ